MKRKWIILDCNYLCHRAKHSTGGLRYGETPTGIIYGFLKSITAFQEIFDTSHIVFCWDSKTNKRLELFPAYKQKRRSKIKEYTDEELEFENAFRLQMKKLRKIYLPMIGYKNVFCQKGYEADDLIASVCLQLPKKNEAIIISADQDLYQLIRHNISFYNPQKGKILTLQGFYKKYGIMPEHWGTIKCLAGCSTDEVPGIKGIGEKTALKYMLGTLKETSKAYLNIKTNISEYLALNNPLVCLPFRGTKIFKLKKDKYSEKGWQKVTEKLGMKSLKDKGRRHGKRKLL